MSQLKSILEPTTATVIEKKSKFIAELFHVSSKEEAEKQIQEVKKKYYDARHHCFAYIIHQNTGTLEKASDDGEPSGTAGAPMLNLLKKYELQNILVIVTRYFGGTLLGTGGLVRAYSEATTKALETATFMVEVLGIEMNLTIPYSEFDYFQYYCHKNDITILKVEYDDYISCTIEVSFQEKEKILHEMNKSALKIQKIEVGKEKYIQKKIEKYTLQK